MEPLSEREQYLMNLADKMNEEKLTLEQMNYVVLGEIASWLMVVASSLEDMCALEEWRHHNG